MEVGDDISVYAQFPISSEKSETRLVTIEPAPFQQAMKCHLTTMRLLDHRRPAFEALSYVWGDSSKAKMIRLDGHLFGVTENLAAALQYLRSPSEERVVWIDAICINQRDKSERSAQVRLMGDIYRSATRVISWLG
ncbi:heterokaryon incompatibility protein-domain-containing protein, partial [Lasiosphaeris hirsuta]